MITGVHSHMKHREIFTNVCRRSQYLSSQVIVHDFGVQSLFFNVKAILQIHYEIICRYDSFVTTQ
jgi:hypothetical protein